MKLYREVNRKTDLVVVVDDSFWTDSVCSVEPIEITEEKLAEQILSICYTKGFNKRWREDLARPIAKWILSKLKGDG